MAKRKSQKKNSLQTIFSRFLLIVAFFVVWIGVIGVRLVHLQVSQHEWLLGKAQGQRRDESKSKLLRGSILDRSDRALAMSVKVKSLYADPAEIDDPDTTSKSLAPLLNKKPKAILADIQDAKQKGKRFLWLARKLDEETARKFNDSFRNEDLKKFDEPKVKGLHWKEEQKRSYPYGTMASQVIGFSDLDDIGRAGIEQSQEQTLKGPVVEKWKERDRLGRVYEEDTEEREPPKDIVLTISSTIQFKVEQALKKGVEAAHAKSGMAVVMDPKTGEILAMANYPTFDPNRFSEALPNTITNNAVQSIYTPGSVFKLVTYSGALEEKMISTGDKIDCSKGSIEVAGHVFNDSHKIGIVSYPDAFAKSSNVGAIKTGLELGKDNFYRYARQFGFGEKTGIELPAETSGMIRSPEGWSGDSLASMSIGYEIGVSALQTATAFATIANDGVRISPRIIKEIRESDGKSVSVTELQKRQVISSETARGMRKMMRQVVLNGTGTRAQLVGYTSAGKTGTAWKYDPALKRINENRFVSSFGGMAPVDDPSIVIAVVIDEPQGGARDGGHVAAPVFQDIAEQILPELNIAPDGNIKQEVAEEISEAPASKTKGENVIVEKKAAVPEKEKISQSSSLKTEQKIEPKPSEEKKKTSEKTIKETISRNDAKSVPKNKPPAGRTKEKT